MIKRKIFIGIIFLISLALFFYSKRIDKGKLEEYLGNYKYLVGEIEVYFERSTIRFNVGKSSITYSYIVNNKKILNNYDLLFYELPENPKKGNKYIVLYNENEPQKSILLGNYKIENNLEFKKYIEEFKNNPTDYKNK